MRKSELTLQQQRELEIFSLILECDGWEDPDGVEARMDRGDYVNPEGVRIYTEENQVFEAQFHAPVHMITLSLLDKSLQRKIGIFFLYSNRPERILEWITLARKKLTIANHQELIRSAQKICPTVLVLESSPEDAILKPTGNF